MMTPEQAKLVAEAISRGIPPGEIMAAIKMAGDARPVADELAFSIVTARRDKHLVHELVKAVLEEQVDAGAGPQQMLVVLAMTIQNLAEVLALFGHVAEQRGEDIDRKWSESVLWAQTHAGQEGQQ
jgi:hypothetical protein